MPSLRVKGRRVHRGRVDAIGYLMYAVAYFVVVAGAVGAVVSHVDGKVAVPWASPWRMWTPKLFVVGGPAMFILALAFATVGISFWVVVPLLIASLVAFWVAAVLIEVEWLRRRAEDRATGIARPERLGI